MQVVQGDMSILNERGDASRAEPGGRALASHEARPPPGEAGGAGRTALLNLLISTGKLARSERFERPTLRFVV